jgi:stage II sporulation protein D
VKRGGFLAAFATALLAPALPITARAQQPLELRILLGNGDAQPLPSGGFEFGGRAYRGTFSRSADGSIVNAVPLDEYLYSVVPREMSPSWPAAALQAQAICSRTYVLRRKDPSRPYDIVPSALAQVYEGIAAESSEGRAAVDATAGLVLAYEAQFANVAYSSCCGGHTESASDAWGGAEIPYMSGVVCPYCRQSPEYRWSRAIPIADVGRATQTALDGYGELEDVRTEGFDASGRVREFLLVARRGAVSIPGNAFRIAVGPAVLPSLLIHQLSVAQSTMDVQGGGNGHGVGLCQWGARGIALAGGSAAAALGFYFPGTRIVEWTSVSSPPTITSSPLI